jgi:allophanate hydrolase subunit 2
LQTVWRLDARSDRIGFRLAGSALPAPSSDLASFPVIAGCVQLPGNGLPVVLGPDCGVTGGYPVLGIVDQATLNALAQARPGTTIRMRRSY